MKFQYVVYWQNKKGHKKWQCCPTIEKAERLKNSLANENIFAYLAKDVKQF